jgi:hypothetical protein
MRFPIPKFSFWIFFALWLILMITGRYSMFRDPGTFWHLVVGEQIISNGQIPREDNFSFTPSGQPWVADQWLAEIGMAGIYRLAGWDGLLTITTAILAGVFTFIATILLRGGIHWLLTGMIIALLLLTGSHQFHIRPLVFTFVGLTITFSLLVDVENENHSLHRCWLLVPLFILWANLHGGVLLGIGCVGLCCMGWFLLWAVGKESPIRGRLQVVEILLLLLVLLLSFLLNPYGVDLIRAWFITLSMPLPKLIQEHGPLTLTSAVGLATLSIAVIYAIVLLSSAPKRLRITWLVPLVFFALALRVRNAPLFAITAVLSLPDMLPYSSLAPWLCRREWLVKLTCNSKCDTESERCKDHRCASNSSIRRFFNAIIMKCPIFFCVALIAVVFIIQTAGISMPVVGRGWAGFDPAHWPVDLLPDLHKINENSSPTEQRIFNDLKFGGFLIYHTPKMKIFIDDRCSLYGTEFLEQYDSARRENPRQIDLWQSRYRFQYALVETDSPFDSYMQGNNRWKLLRRSPPAALYQYHLGIP